MNGEMIARIRKATTLNEIWGIFNEYYDLDEPMPIVTGSFAKGKIITHLSDIIDKLQVNERTNTNRKTKRRLF